MMDGQDTSKLNEAQKKAYALWQVSPDGFPVVAHPRPFTDSALVCIQRHIYTTSVSVIGLDGHLITRFCYDTVIEALYAMVDWESDGFKGKPKGYIKQKPDGDYEEVGFPPNGRETTA